LAAVLENSAHWDLAAIRAALRETESLAHEQLVVRSLTAGFVKKRQCRSAAARVASGRQTSWASLKERLPARKRARSTERRAHLT
jgi:hypothetical protein